jgi:predicted ATP-binding protein involved in virulence
MFSKANPGTFTVIIDEAENHLHPALQRTLLPNLLRAFPTAMFIVSTHSPLIVGSVRDSAVYALRYNDNKKVVSERLDLQEKALSASEVLNDILGVTSSLPVWVEDELAKILREISELGVDENSFFRLRERLASVGLERLFPEAMTTFGNQL